MKFKNMNKTLIYVVIASKTSQIWKTAQRQTVVAKTAAPNSPIRQKHYPTPGI